jgi:acyl carrier protein
MIGDTPAVRELRLIPRSDRTEALAALVMAEFRAALLMAADDDLPTEESFFDLGLTSLRLVELKQRLEGLLGRDISANALFNRPTVTQLLDHLTGQVLTDLFEGTTAAPPAAGGVLANPYPM